ncbi:restriction endonuclease subunit S, partial [Methanobrevibacter smithii]|uniref:restriction endonuclease subunit S n=1 Tax=Methanobrevibacter smithii TaxID=2173 RepID=UPI00384F3887
MKKELFNEEFIDEYKYPLYANALENEGLLGYYKEYKYNPNSITVTARGNIGHATARKNKFNAVGRLIILTPKEDLNIEFFTEYINNNVKIYIESTGVPQLTAPSLKINKLHYPTLNEQNKISNLLIMLNNKIELLGQKHQLYQYFKKYLMQQIFTQKLRFVDFNNSSWKDYKFKDLGTVKSGVGFSNKYQGHLDLDYNFYKVSDMNLKGNEKVMTRSNNTIDDNLLKDIGVKLIENPSIIFAKVGEAIFLNRKRIAKQPFLIDNNMMAFSPNENVDLEFMYYLATSINFGKYAQTGALPSYNASDIYSIKCKIPPIEEQKRIGKLLSLADNKIDFCSNQLNKTQEFKKGLLQQMFVVRINWRC